MLDEVRALLDDLSVTGLTIAAVLLVVIVGFLVAARWAPDAGVHRDERR